MNAYGHASTCRILRCGRAQELLAGGGTARRHAARRLAPDPVTRAAAPAATPPPAPEPAPRAAARPATARPVGAAGRADRGGPALVRVGAAAVAGRRAAS